MDITKTIRKMIISKSSETKTESENPIVAGMMQPQIKCNNAVPKSLTKTIFLIYWNKKYFLKLFSNNLEGGIRILKLPEIR